MSSMNSKLRSDSFHGADLKIFIKDVADKQGRKRAITVRSWATIKDVKDVLQQHLHIPPSAQRLFFGPLMSSGGELPNYRSLHDAGIYRSGETILLDIKGGSESSAVSSISSLNSSGLSDVCVSSSLIDATPKSLRRTVQQARRGFAVGLKPELVLDGSGGTYFLHDARKVKVAVFKPADEEPYAENNPRGYVKQGPVTGGTFEDSGDMSLRAGISPGEACLREVAAFLLDHGGFSDVPTTTLAEARHSAFNTNGSRLKLAEGGASVGSHSIILPQASPPSSPLSPQELEKKVGSVQTFVNAECSMDDLSPSMISVNEVHKIAILDIRIMNADRNSANLLCRRKPEDPDSFELVPIDHGYCLRSVCDVAWFDWCWLDWPQLKKPLSRRSREYILRLDIEADVRLLHERLNIGTEALDYFRASSKLLRAGVKAGMTLYDIAVLCCRNDGAGDVPSKLEILTSMATELATAAVVNGRWDHVAASRALAEQLSPDAHGSASGHFNKSMPSIQKSLSNVNFPVFVHNDVEKKPVKVMPTVMQTSGSDSGSDLGDVGVELEECENEECDEWAAAFVAGVSNKDKSLVSPGRSRSVSIVSNSSSSSGEDEDSTKLSSSPSGFWHVRPGSTNLEEPKDVTWSPHVSPKQFLYGPLSALPSGVLSENLLPPINKMGSKVPLGMIPSGLPMVQPQPPPPPQIDFPTPLDLGAPAETILPGFSAGTLSHQPRPGSMKRSQSYSAFSFKNLSLEGSAAIPHKKKKNGFWTNVEDEQVRRYFLKFVDLLIDREIAAFKRRK